MPAITHITDSAKGYSAKVDRGGALAVGPSRVSVTFNATLGTDNTAVNVVPAKADHVFQITGILLTANSNVSNVTSATVTIYTADTETTAKGSALTTLFIIPVVRDDKRDITGILAEAEVGKWINAETTDDDVFVTILGYYIKVEN